MYSTSLSQGIGKRQNGNKSYPAGVADIKKRSPIRYNKSTGTGYQLVCSHNQVSLVLAQVGECQDKTRQAVVGEITPNGFNSHANFKVDGITLSWEELAAIIGIDSDRLLISVRKFALKFRYVTPQISDTEIRCQRVHNAAKKSRSVRRSNKIKFV